MFSSWLLLIHLPTILTVSANIRCYPFTSAPPLADCRHIVISMPSLSGDFFDEGFGLEALTPHASPFFPHALFYHGDCMIQVSYYSDSESARHPDWLDGPPSPHIALSQSSIFKLWTEIKSTAEDLNDKCISRYQAGSAWNAIGVPEIEGAWVLVEVFKGKRPWWLAGSWTEQARQARLDAINALRDASSGRQGQAHGMRNRYEVSVFDVP